MTAYGAAQGLPAHPVQDVNEDRTGQAWVVADGKLYRLAQGHWQDVTKNYGLPSGQVASLSTDTKGTSWIKTKTAIYRMDADAKHAQLVLALELPCRGMLEDPKGGMWLALTAADGSSLIKQVELPGYPIRLHQTISVKTLTDAKFDQSGALWISSEGLERFSIPAQDQLNAAQGKPVEHEHFGAADGLSSDSTRYLLTDRQGDLWVATLRGLDRFRVPVLVKARLPVIDSSTVPDLAQGTGGQVWLGGKNVPLYAVTGAEFSPIGPSLKSYLCLFQDREGALWFDSSDALWHRTGDRLEQITPPPDITPGRLRKVVQLADGSLLFSFFERGVYHRVGDRWERTALGDGGGEYPLVLFVDARGSVWAGYASGKVTRGNGSAEQTVPSDNPSLGAIAAFYEGPLGMLATGQRGIAALVSGQLRHLHFADTQLAENITGLVQSGDGDLWLNGRNGIARIRNVDYAKAVATGGAFVMPGRLFTEDDLKGPAPFFYDLPTAAKDKTGLLWFNTAGWLVYIDPSSLPLVPTEPTVSIVALLADGVALQPGAPVPPGTHTLRIQYFGSNLTAPEEVRYRYRLLGVDDTWQYVERRTEAVYTGLRPRTLTFEVSARNADNQWSAPERVRIQLQPTFVQKPIFLVLCGLLLASLAFLLYRLRVVWLMRSMQERADARLDERVRLARDLHDTLLQGFQGLILRFHVAAQRVPEQTDVRDQLDGALQRAEKLMIEGRNRIVLLRADDLSGLNLHVALQSVCEELAENSQTGFSLQKEGEVLELQALVKNELYWIAREALTNAFSHAGAKEIRLLCDYGCKELRFLCQDDGLGMDMQMLSAGGRPGHYGLPGMRERAEKINGKLTCQSAPMQGTSIEARCAYQQTPILSGVIRSFADKLNIRLEMR